MTFDDFLTQLAQCEGAIMTSFLTSKQQSTGCRYALPVAEVWSHFGTALPELAGCIELVKDTATAMEIQGVTGCGKESS